MKPPICEVCDDRFDPADGELITFRGTAESEAFDKRAEAPGFVGHRPNSGWFCPEHVDKARPMAASMTLAEALRDIAGLTEALPPSSKRTTSEPPSVTLDSIDDHGEPMRGPFLPTPDPAFDAVEAKQHVIAGRIASDVGTILLALNAELEPALGVAYMRNAGSIGSTSSDPADLVWASHAPKCSTNVASRHGGDVAIFNVTARHLDDDKLVGEHARLLVQQRERSIFQVVMVAAPEAVKTPDGRVLLNLAHIRIAPDHEATFEDPIDVLLAALQTAAADPFSRGPDLDGVDLRGGEIRRGMEEGDSSIEWQLKPVALQTARQQFVELAPLLFDQLELGTAPELVVTTKRQWNPMDGAVEPDCPYVDTVRHEPTADEGSPVVSITSDTAHWNDTDISNVSTHLFIDVDGVRVSAFASGRGDPDACTTLSLFRPTSAKVVAALIAAFAPWLG